MVWIILTILFAIIIGVLGYLLYISTRKVDQAIAYCEAYVRFIGAVYMKFLDTQARMKEIDRIGAFQADDEVGVVFKELDTLIAELHEFINKYVNADDEKAEKAQD